MKIPRIYVRGLLCGQEYVGHMTKMDANYSLDSHEEISKAEYQKLRNDGMPSYGEYETECRRQGIKPRRRSWW